MRQYGPAERAVFESLAMPLYEEAVTQGGLGSQDPRLQDGSEHRPALDMLIDLGLLTRDPSSGQYVAADPATAQSHVVAPLGQRGAELLNESARWSQAFGHLAQTWRRYPAATQGPFVELHGEAIRVFLSSIVADAESELITAQPQTGRADEVKVAIKRDVEALGRGVKMRTLYQHAARRQSATHKYVAAVTQLGAEVRTLDEFFNRLIVVDRRVALIPGHQGLRVALAIREPSLVAYLVDVFERAWERGRPFTNKDSRMMRDIAAEQRAMTIRMLIKGHADPASAKRLGVSPRTYAGYISDLKLEYDALTRFQLGYEMGRRGVSGRENAPSDDA